MDKLAVRIDLDRIDNRYPSAFQLRHQVFDMLDPVTDHEVLLGGRKVSSVFGKGSPNGGSFFAGILGMAPLENGPVLCHG